MFILSKKFRKTVDKRAIEFCYNEMESVGAKAAQGLFNYKCFFNAVEYATRHKDVEVIMGLYFQDGSVFLHFWNKRDETHLETSLGHMASDITYYPIRKIHESDWKIIDQIFSEALDYYNDKLIRWYEKPFVKRAV